MSYKDVINHVPTKAKTIIQVVIPVPIDIINRDNQESYKRKLSPACAVVPRSVRRISLCWTEGGHAARFIGSWSVRTHKIPYLFLHQLEKTSLAMEHSP
jgi:hypothetical protein